MIKGWEHPKNILIIRADNMGDPYNAAPAIGL